MARNFRGLLMRAGLPKLGGPYLLRHTNASHLLGMSAPITYVSAQMGHSTPAITLSTYTHFLPSSDHDQVDRLEAWRTAGPQDGPQRIHAAARQDTIPA